LETWNWIAKLLVFLLFLILAYLLPNPFFDGWTQVARVVAGLYLVVQIIMLIDFAYRWNEDWIDEKKDWKKGILAVSLFLYCGCIVGLALAFIWFGGGGCNTEKFVISWTLIMTLIFSLVSMLEIVEKGAILTSAVVTTYCYWLLYSALLSDPDNCNTFDSDKSEVWEMVSGIVLAAASITYAAWNLSNSNNIFGGSEEADQEPLSPDAVEQSDKDATPLEGDKTGKPENAEKKEKSAYHVEESDHRQNNENDERITPANVKRFMKFHLVLSASALYMSMLLTNWGTTDGSEYNADSYDVSKESMWIKIASQWLARILYTWSLVAPIVFPDREF
jgi:hypothetical protein